MTITQDQIKKITKNLAKLPKTSEKIEHDLNSILGYVEMLNEVDTTGVIPTISITKKGANLRKDIEKKEVDSIELLKCSSGKIIANQIAIGNIMK